MQYEQITEQDMEVYANMGCMMFQTETCEQKETPLKVQFEMIFHAGNNRFLFETGKIEAKMYGEWEKMSVTEEIRLVNTCIELLP